MRSGESKKCGYFLRGDNRGASLIAVIVALVFVVTMGVIITDITTTNIRLREIELSEKENFYSADAVMNALKNKMAQEVAVKQLQEAYRGMLSRYYGMFSGYAQAGSYDEFHKNVLQPEYNRTYIDTLAAYFRKGDKDEDETVLGSVDSDPSGLVIYRKGTYDVKLVEDLIAGMLGVSASHPESDDEKGKAIFETADGRVALNIAEDDAVFTMDYEEGLFALKNIKIEFRNNRGFETWVSTDLVFDTPDFQFDDGTKTSFMKYALIADESIEISGTNTVSAVNGSVYAGAGGIYNEGNGVTAYFSGDNIVTRGDIVADGASQLRFGVDTVNGPDPGGAGVISKYQGTTHIWARNVYTKGISNSNTDPQHYKTNLEMKGEINIEDDLALNGRNSQVKLIGSYNGYNFRENYSQDNLDSNTNPVTPATDSIYSSAIMVNNEDCILDLRELDHLYLAGRTFISRGDTFSKDSINDDIMLGESLSVRADQIAYLVGTRFLNFGADGKPTGIKTDDYKIYTGVDLGDSDKYWKNGKLAVEVVSYQYRSNVTDTITAYAPDTLYYLEFPTGEMANTFFYDYWRGMRGEEIAGYESDYAEAIRLNENVILTLSGDLLYRDKTDTTPGDPDDESGTGTALDAGYEGFELIYQDKEYFNDTRWTTPEADLGNGDYKGVYWGRSDKLARTYKSLVDDLVGIYTRIAPGKVRFTVDDTGRPNIKEKPLFYNLINITEEEVKEGKWPQFDVIAGLAEKSGGDITVNGKEIIIKDSDSGIADDWKIVLYKNANETDVYSISSPFKGIVIATGDVDIKPGTFTGMVISGGKIQLNGVNVQVNGDADLVKEIFSTVMGKNYGLEFVKLFKEYQSPDMDAEVIALIGDYLFYENWMKNEE